jgi:hypothetical protein
MDAARRELMWPRVLMVAGVVAFAAIVIVNAVARGRRDWTFLVVVALHGPVIAMGLYTLMLHRRARTAHLAVTGGGFAVRPSLLFGPTAVMLVPLMALPASATIDGWRDVAARQPTVAIDAAFAAAMSGVVLLGLATAAVIMPTAWRGYTVHLTPAGIRWRAPLHRRVIPWAALGPEVGHHSGRVWLLADRPDLVVQRGRLVGGPPGQPTLPLGADAPMVAEVIRWYLHHPADRAEVGSTSELDRMRARLESTAPSPPAQAPPVVNAPPRIGRLGTAVRLVYAAAVTAVIAAAGDLTITVQFRDRLVAAEHAMWAFMDPPAEGEVVFTTDTAAFATGFATVALVVTLIVATVAVALARRVRAGSGPARTGLVSLSGLGVPAAMCSIATPAISLAAEPTAGLGLNLWAALRLAEGLILTVIALLVVVLLTFSGQARSQPTA